MVRGALGLKTSEKAGATARKRARGKVKIDETGLDEGTQEQQRTEAAKRGGRRKTSSALHAGAPIKDSLDFIMAEQRKKEKVKKLQNSSTASLPKPASASPREQSGSRGKQRQSKRRKPLEDDRKEEADVSRLPDESPRAKRQKARANKGAGEEIFEESREGALGGLETKAGLRGSVKAQASQAGPVPDKDNLETSKTRQTKEHKTRKDKKTEDNKDKAKAEQKVNETKVDEAKVDETKPADEDKVSAAGEEVTGKGAGPVRVNRAPVLTLWVAVVAEREGMSFAEGLTFGRALSGLYAHAKGKRLGLYEEAEEEVKEERRKRREQFEKVQVFGTRLPALKTPAGQCYAVQDGKAIKPEGVEAYLRKAFGENFEAVKDALQALASAYPSHEIGTEAYGLYEQFRPTIPGGVRGWGAKGELDLDVIRRLA